ncbi:MAG TPA: hypothetical protein VJT75_11795 [Thermoleophilaceae bacterium]|nr:hypothetical protein [Thermoleophilaceae bacterium]
MDRNPDRPTWLQVLEGRVQEAESALAATEAVVQSYESLLAEAWKTIEDLVGRRDRGEPTP